MGDLNCHRSGCAYVAENNYRSGGLASTVTDGRDGIFNGSFKSITPNEDTIRRQVYSPVLLDCHFHRVGGGFATTSVQNSQSFGHRPAGCFLQRPARHFLCDEIQEGNITGAVRAGHSVADAAERYLGALLFHE